MNILNCRTNQLTLHWMKQSVGFYSNFTNLSIWKTCKIIYSHIGLSDHAKMIIKAKMGQGRVCSDIFQLHFYDS